MNMEDVINLPSCSEHTQRNTHKASCYERCLRELNRNERRMRGIQGGKKKKKEIKGGEKPMWWREILILSEIIRSLPPSTFPFIASFLFSISALPFYQPVPSLSSAFPYLSSCFPPLPLHSFHSFVLSLSVFHLPRPLSVTVGELQADEAACTNVAIFDKTHTHPLLHAHMRNRKGRGGHQSFKTHWMRLRAEITNIATHREG